MNSDRFEGAVQDAAGKIQQTVGMATGSSQMRAEGVVREVAGKSQNIYGQAKDGFRDASDALSASAQDVYHRVSQDVERGARAVEAKVEENPLTGLLIAGAVGFLLGLIVNARR